MLNTTYEILDEILVRAGTSSTTATGGLYTDTILKSWVTTAHRWAASYKKWTFTEGRVSTTYVQEESGYPEGWRPDSIRYLTVGDKRFSKVAFEDYQRYKENSPNGQDRIFSDYGLTYYINPTASLSGTVVLYGQYTPAALDMTDNTALTVFSGREEDCNAAIVEEVLSYAKKREKKLDESAIHHKNATDLLEAVWKRLTDEQFGYHMKDRGMFEYIDVLAGGDFSDPIHRDRWY